MRRIPLVHISNGNLLKPVTLRSIAETDHFLPKFIPPPLGDIVRPERVVYGAGKEAGFSTLVHIHRMCVGRRLKEVLTSRYLLQRT
jgi:hypothetical protein